MQAKERNYKQRIVGLEQQVCYPVADKTLLHFIAVTFWPYFHLCVYCYRLVFIGTLIFNMSFPGFPSRFLPLLKRDKAESGRVFYTRQWMI